MSNVTEQGIEIKLPYWNELLNQIPQEEEQAHRVLNNAIQFQAGLESLSPAQFQDPTIIENIQARMCELGKMVDLEVPDITSDIPVMRKDVVSQEGVFEVFGAVIKKIVDWLYAAIEWFKKLAGQFKVSEKIQKSAIATVVKVTRGKANSLTPEQAQLPKKFQVPARALVVFHTPRYTPKPGFVFDAKAVKLSFPAVKSAIQTLVDALIDDTVGAEKAVAALTDAVLNDKNVDHYALNKINEHRKLRGLHHNGFQAIGMGLTMGKTNGNNPVRTEKTVIKNMAREYGWMEAGSFTIEASPAELVEIATLVESQMNDLNRLVDKLHNQTLIKGIEKRVGELRKHADTLLKEGKDGTPSTSKQTPAHQRALMLRLQAVQDIVSQQQLNIQSVELFVRNYFNLLIAYGSSAQNAIVKETIAQ